NVRGLDVAMDNPRGMRGIQSIGDFNAERQEYFDFEGAAGDALLQGSALQALHDDERSAVLLPDIVDGADIGVVEAGGAAGLALETGKRIGIADQVVREEFEGDEAVETRILGLVDHAHSAYAQFFCDAV